MIPTSTPDVLQCVKDIALLLMGLFVGWQLHQIWFTPHREEAPKRDQA